MSEHGWIWQKRPVALSLSSVVGWILRSQCAQHFPKKGRLCISHATNLADK